MSYQLVIAEKPSVARSIAGVIGADKKQDGYMEGKPVTEVQEIQVPAFKIVSVFDVSQTEGEPLPSPCSLFVHYYENSF